MLAPTSQISIIVLLTIFLLPALSFPYSIYNMKNQRASRTIGSDSDGSHSSSSFNSDDSSSINSNNKQLIYIPRQQHFFNQLAYRTPVAAALPYFGNYDTLYDLGADKFYVNDKSGSGVDDHPDRKYLYGKPTYHGVYKPTRYYYARPPSYSYYGDHSESTNPLDDLHEEMLQEDHNRQRNWPSGKAIVPAATSQLYQRTGQPKSLNSDFMKNLMFHNNGMSMNTQPMEMNVAVAATSYFDPLKFQHGNQFNHYGSSPTNKQIYYNRDNVKDNDDETVNHNDDSNGDNDEKDLESLQKHQNRNSWNIKSRDVDDHEDDDDGKLDNVTHHSDKNKHDANDLYNGGYDTGFDYDEDTWINWNRKRSLPKKELRKLRALEQKLTETLRVKSDALKLTITMPPPSTNPYRSTSNNTEDDSPKSEMRKNNGQKEVVLPRFATPLRRHYPAKILDALSKSADEMIQSNQVGAKIHALKNDGDKLVAAAALALASASASRKEKRYVFRKTSLAQQLNDLKRKIKV